MNVLKFEVEKCIGCGACAKDCPRDLIEITDGKARMVRDNCMECWHCIAVCPTETISSPKCPSEDLLPCKEGTDIDPAILIKALKSRRSVRQYKKDKVGQNIIEDIITGGRFTPTGCNRQPLSYFVLDSQLEEIKLLCMENLREFTLANPNSPAIGNESIKNRFLTMHEEYIKTGRDRLFFNAPLVIAIAADKSLGGRPQVDGGMAASNMGLVANAHGLGYCYIGFFVTATENVAEMRDRLGLKDDEQVVACMAIGYPNVKYKRTVSRNPAIVK